MEKALPLTVQRIIALLDARGMGGRQYLEAMGLNRSALTDWKNGKSKPTAETIRRTAELLGVTADYLMGLSDIPEPPREDSLPPLYFKLAKDARQLELTERDIEFLLDIARRYKRLNREDAE